MNIKQKIKSAWQRLSGKSANKSTDSELGADEVVRKEVFPKTATSAKSTKTNSAASSKTSCTRKPASKRTRPTNDNYQMIDPSGDTCDTGKS